MQQISTALSYLAAQTSSMFSAVLCLQEVLIASIPQTQANALVCFSFVHAAMCFAVCLDEQTRPAADTRAVCQGPHQQGLAAPETHQASSMSYNFHERYMPATDFSPASAGRSQSLAARHSSRSYCAPSLLPLLLAHPLLLAPLVAVRATQRQPALAWHIKHLVQQRQLHLPAAGSHRLLQAY